MHTALLPILALAGGGDAAGHGAAHAGAYADVGALQFAKAAVDPSYGWLRWMLLAPQRTTDASGASSIHRSHP